MIPLLTAAIDPYAIYERAREVWTSQRYPSVVSYAVSVTAGDAGTQEQRHYHEYWSSGNDRVYVKPPISDEQLAHPYKPSAGVAFYGWNIGGPRAGTGLRDLIGVPVLAPNYSFGISTYVPSSQLTPAEIVSEIRREYHDPAPRKISTLEQQTGLKTIALVTSSAHAYRIALIGIEAEEHGRAYHLSLAPLRDPLKYRLRDLWIDTSTYQTERARIGANFTDTATQNVPWMVRFQQIGGATYIEREDAEHAIVGYHGLMYSRYSVSFSTVGPAVLPQFSDLTTVTAPLTEP